MTVQITDKPISYCGRVFAATEIQRIRQLTATEPKLNRAQLSRRVCNELHWLRADGRPKDMSCRVAMLKMERDGLLTLPPPQKRNGNGCIRPRFTAASDPQEPVRLPIGALHQLRLHLVQTRHESSLWNELVERYHYLKYKPLAGAQTRYMVFHDAHLLAVLGFSAAAWKVAPRDQFIGWDHRQRRRNLQRIVNNSRFLILPWVQVRNLASCILAAVSRRLPEDWRNRYGYEPVLLETFVDRDRFRGTCYRAANWIRIGETRGRGKLDQQHRGLSTVKEIYLYPLRRDFRQKLHSIQPAQD